MSRKFSCHFIIAEGLPDRILKTPQMSLQQHPYNGKTPPLAGRQRKGTKLRRVAARASRDLLRSFGAVAVSINGKTPPLAGRRFVCGESRKNGAIPSPRRARGTIPGARLSGTMSNASCR